MQKGRKKNINQRTQRPEYRLAQAQSVRSEKGYNTNNMTISFGGLVSNKSHTNHIYIKSKR